MRGVETIHVVLTKNQTSHDPSQKLWPDKVMPRDQYKENKSKMGKRGYTKRAREMKKAL